MRYCYKAMEACPCYYEPEDPNEVYQESKFDGGLLGLIGTAILRLLAGLLMLVLAAACIAGGLFVVVSVLGNIDAKALIDFENLWGTILELGLVNQLLIIPFVLVGLLFLAFGCAWQAVIGLRWKTRHTIIRGQRLYFDGTTWQLFGNILKWSILTVITLTIYGWWLPIKYKKWVTKHTDHDIDVA